MCITENEEGNHMQYIDILFLLVTLGVGFVLYTRLGRRTGQEKTFAFRLGKDAEVMQGNLSNNALLTILPAEMTQISEIQKYDKKFSIEHFLDKIKTAFEKVVKAFVQGDKRALSAFLEPKLYTMYAKEVDDLKEKNVKTDLEFFRLISAEIKDVQTNQTTAHISVHFVSEQTHVQRNDKGKVISGDANFIDHISELWTFKRAIKSKGPWMLSGITPYEAT